MIIWYIFLAFVGLATTGCLGPKYRQHTFLGTRPLPLPEEVRAVRLRTTPNAPVNLVGRITGLITTPFKRLGVFGWTDYGLRATASGTVYQVALSTDRFLTLDLKVSEFTLDGQPIEVGPQPYYVRAEVYLSWVPLAPSHRPRCGDVINVAGKFVWDGDGFYEIHPQENAPMDVPKIVHRD